MADGARAGCSGVRFRTKRGFDLTLEDVQDVFANEESEEDISLIDSDSEAYECEPNVTSEDSSDGDEVCAVAPRPKKARNTLAAGDYSWTGQLFSPKLHDFDDLNSGINKNRFSPDNDSTELDFFKQFVNDDVVGFIVNETNRYAAQYAASNVPLPPHSLVNKWKNTNPDEMYCFLALTMLMVRNKKLSMKEYWSTNWLLQSEAFPKVMSRDRYFAILRMMHFCNNEEQPERDRLFKLRHIFSLVKDNFKSVFYPFQNLCIDESLVLFKGRLLFKQFIRTKRHRFGIKLFVLCDVQTGYVLDVIVYTGATTEMTHVDNLGISGSIVITLLEPYLGKGHSLFTDNWYTSPLLAKELHNQKTNSCGTVNSKRRHMPTLNEPKKLAKGGRQSKCTDIMMALRWMDKREVRMLTTIHKDVVKDTNKIDRATQEVIQKPECILSYNANMGSVDRSDMMLSSVECVRKTVKWYKKLFFHLIDICLLNAHGLYQLHKQGSVPLASFQLQLIGQLLENHHTPRQQKSGRRVSTDMPLRLTERHFPKKVPATEKKKTASRKCHVCAHTQRGPKKRSESRYMCADCDVGLCIDPCFADYHLLKKY